LRSAERLESITVDNGSEFCSKAMEVWARQYGVQLDFIRPGRPIDNGYIESFNGRLRNECLNVEAFFDLADTREKLECWRQDYNQVRPHSALFDRTPEELAARNRQLRSEPAARSAWPAELAGAVHSASLSVEEADSFSVHPQAGQGWAEKLY
jgi:hypothetical protein